ncbi:MAG: hydroxymethylbilane synthase [Paracoccaceae bacterium]|nr:hydroxymethylbilane synthase [Paracoccaceae bacterium]
MKKHLPSPAAPLRVGTRGSPLAQAQALEACDRLARAFDLPKAAFEIVVIKTTGDRIQDRPLRKIGGKGLFTREIEWDLLAGRIDIAVHSMKDMPVEQPAGLILSTYLPRQDVRDALICPTVNRLDDIAFGAKVGTSSLRRKAQVLLRRPDLQVVEFRGNVQTRLKKLDAGAASCTFLAMAGLNRLGMANIPATPIEPEKMLPAIAQGAIGIEQRLHDPRCSALLEAVQHTPTAELLLAERAFLAGLGGSCETPIAGLATRQGGHILLRGEILRPDGSECLNDSQSAPVEDAAALGSAMAEKLRDLVGPGFFELP